MSAIADAKLELARIKRNGLQSLLAPTKYLIEIDVDEDDAERLLAQRIFRKSFLVAQSMTQLPFTTNQYISVLSLSRLLVENLAVLNHLLEHPDEIERFQAFALVQFLRSHGPNLKPKETRELNDLITANKFRTSCGLAWTNVSTTQMIRNLEIEDHVIENLLHTYAEGSAKIHMSAIDATEPDLSLTITELDCGFHGAGNAYHYIVDLVLGMPLSDSPKHLKASNRVEAVVAALYDASERQRRVINRLEKGPRKKKKAL